MSENQFQKLLKKIAAAKDGGSRLIAEAIAHGQLTWEQRFLLGEIASDNAQAAFSEAPASVGPLPRARMTF